MLSRRLFEGPDIQKVLARIQSELGPSAQIISAEKVRRGGVGGFFARETYQVVVDGPEEAVSRPPLLSARRRTARIAPAPTAPAASPAGERTVPVPSTEGAPFAEVLRRLTENAEPVAPDAPATAPAPTSSGTHPGGAGPAPRGQVDAVIDEDLTALLRQMPAARAVAEGATVADSAEAWLADTDAITSDREMEMEPMTAPPLATQLIDLPEMDGLGIDAPETDPPDIDGPGMAADAREARELEKAETGHLHPALAVSEPGSISVAEDRRPVLADLQAVPLPPADPKAGLNGITPARARPALKRMGLPASLLPAEGRLGLVPALFRSLSRMPMAPPVCLQPGEVMAVIGAADRALVLASRLALSIGLDPAEVVVASPAEVGEEGSDRIVIGSGAAAESHAEEWATRARPTVVSIAAAPGSGRETWASNVIEALQPAAVWGVVEAMRKPEDVSAWSDAVGQVDALALEDVDATTSPAAVLGTGIPVALLDGQLASPEAWTALLAGRLRAAA